MWPRLACLPLPAFPPACPHLCRISCSFWTLPAYPLPPPSPPPPACMQDLMFLGDFEMAKMRAQQEAKWLMLNLQDSNEFDSHR